MSIKRVFSILAKDLHSGPRSPMFIFAILMPLIITFLIQVVFGSLFEPEPRLGIVDRGDSEITEKAQKLEGIQTVLVEDAEELKRKVEKNDLDVGLVLVEGFDEMVRLNQKPQLGFFIGGESLASNRIILSITTLDLIREVEGLESPVNVEVVALGEEQLPLAQRLVPLVVFYAIFVAGVFLPAMNMVEEKERRTLSALLVTPTKMSEFILAKAGLGFMMALVIILVTLLLNNALGSEPWALLLSLVVAALMASEISVLYAAFAKDGKSLYMLVKSLGMLFMIPAVFYIWPDLPQWMVKIVPTYWMIDPIYKVGVMGEGFSEIWFELSVSLAICVALVFVIIFLKKKMEDKAAL